MYGFGIWERKRVEGGLRDFELIFERDTVQTLDEREMYKRNRKVLINNNKKRINNII